LVIAQHEREGDKAGAYRTERGAGEAIGDTGVGSDGILERHSHEFRGMVPVIRKVPNSTGELCAIGDPSLSPFAENSDIKNIAVGIATR